MKYVAKYNVEGYLIKGKLYEIEETPKVIDPITFNEVTGYLVLGEKGWFRTNIDNFISLEELREQKLNDLGI